MLKGMTAADAVRVAISIAGAAIAFIVVYKIVRAVTGPDLGMLLGPILGTYAGVAVPYLVVRMMGSPVHEAPKAAAGAHA